MTDSTRKPGRPKRLYQCQQCGKRDMGQHETRKHVCSKADAEKFQKEKQG